MEIGMTAVQAAPEEERIKVEVRARPVPEVNGLWERAMAAVAEARAADLKRLVELGLEEEEEEGEEDVEDDWYAVEASQFRETWNRRYSSYYGCFEDPTKIQNKQFTFKKPHEFASPQTTLQVFSVKIAKLRSGLQWPLQVFGMVAIRDSLDHKRNIIFDRPRDNCQIVTREDPYLKLTGPSRAVVVLDYATFEVDLKVKGTTEPEDQWLSFLAVTYRNFDACKLRSCLLERTYASKLSELQFQLGSIQYSVEATIEVRIASGSWPHGLRAQFTASTASISDAEIILLDSDHELRVGEIGNRIKLSRCVVSVEVGGELSVFVKAFLGDKIVVNSVKGFKANTAGVSNGSLSVRFYSERSTDQRDDKGKICKAKGAGKGEISKAKRAGKGEISKAKTTGKGDGPLGVDFPGCCTFDFNISWSVVSFCQI